MFTFIHNNTKVWIPFVARGKVVIDHLAIYFQNDVVYVQMLDPLKTVVHSRDLSLNRWWLSWTAKVRALMNLPSWSLIEAPYPKRFSFLKIDESKLHLKNPWVGGFHCVGTALVVWWFIAIGERTTSHSWKNWNPFETTILGQVSSFSHTFLILLLQMLQSTTVILLKILGEMELNKPKTSSL